MIVIAILGLLIPGYTLARALRAPAPWAAAFPLSALVLTEIVIAYTVMGIPIRFAYVLNAVLAVIIISFAAERFQKSETTGALNDAPPRDVSKPVVCLVAVFVGLALLGIFFRTAMCPLSGPDVVFRWDALPRLMLQQQGLSYYPPVTSQDFSKYVYPDGFPPLVATVYWWLYASWGSAFPRITSIAIFAQAASCCALVYQAARALFSPAGGVLALIALSTSAMFFDGVSIGQENGYTAISFAGQLLFAFAAMRRPKANLVVLAGLFAGLGALTREYGPALSLAGFAVLACQRETRRYLPLFCLVAAACGGPWYIRNWVRTGNPLYSLEIGLGFPVNPVLGGILSVCHEQLRWGKYTALNWVQIALLLLMGAPLALLVGVPGVFAAGRKGIALGISVLGAFFLWFLAIPNTAGGMIYTWRVLTPGWIALSIAAGAFGHWLRPGAGAQTRVLRAMAAAVIIICGVYALVDCWSLPLGPRNLFTAIGSTRNDPLDVFEIQSSIANRLEELKLPASGILMEDCNLAVALQRNTRFRPVMVWSPEVAFVFDPDSQASDVRRKLVDKNIWLVAVSYDSLNNLYLIQFPFYKDLSEHGELFFGVPKTLALLSLRQHGRPSAEAEQKP